MRNIVILGAGYAGMIAALRLSHTTRQLENVTVTLVNASDTFVERIRQHEVAAGHPPKTQSIETMLRGTGVRFVQGWVTGLRPDSKEVEVHSGQTIEVLPYDKLVYALGSSVRRDGIRGVRDHAYTLDSHSAPLLAQRMKAIAKQRGHLVVIGGGLTGIEATTEIAESYPGVQVTMLTGGTLGEGLSQTAQAYLKTTFQSLGIEVHEHSAVSAVEAQQVRLADGTCFPADATLWAAGFQVAPLAKEAGLAVNKAGQTLGDPYLRSISHPDIYAVGDSAQFEARAPLTARMSCQIAMPLGAHAADNLGAWLRDATQQPFAFGYSVQCISLGQKRGLVQMINPDDSMKETIITGRIGSFVKHAILNYTLWSLHFERRFRAYWWPKSIKAHWSQPLQQPLAEH